MIVLRELQEKDAPLMLEWMHDPDILKNFSRIMIDSTIDDSIRFIRESKIPEILQTGQNLHYAIIDKNIDDYLGTVSLKKIDFDHHTAEYAIVVRKNFHGKGIAHAATNLILNKAFIDIDLHRVYLNVYSHNTPARKLYEQMGFKYEGEFREHFFINGKYINLSWYGILRNEYNQAHQEGQINHAKL